MIDSYLGSVLDIKLKSQILYIDFGKAKFKIFPRRNAIKFDLVEELVVLIESGWFAVVL
jgi:hypothetical protein